MCVLPPLYTFNSARLEQPVLPWQLTSGLLQASVGAATHTHKTQATSKTAVEYLKVGEH